MSDYVQPIDEVEHRWSTLAGYSAVCRRIGDPVMGVYRAGYVQLPRTHPWYGVDWSDLDPAPEVHGGVTFTGLQAFGDGYRSWWVGFDCLHAFDRTEPWPGAIPINLPPRMLSLRAFTDNGGIIRTTAHVKNECEQLAQQLALAASTTSTTGDSHDAQGNDRRRGAASNIRLINDTRRTATERR